jgi:nitrate reductase (cytochrome), electron transfer subunit
MKLHTLLLVLATLVALPAWAADPPSFTDAARGPTALTESTQPPRLGNQVNDDVRLPRNYAAQPPVIPHRTDGYQVDRNFNKCLDCHARARSDFSGAVPVSASHYMDRNGKVLEQISSRRYFCNQCHVPQEANARPFVRNVFQGLPAQPEKKP